VDTLREGESIPDEVLSENLMCGDTLECRFASSYSDVTDENRENTDSKHFKDESNQSNRHNKEKEKEKEENIVT